MITNLMIINFRFITGLCNCFRILHWLKVILKTGLDSLDNDVICASAVQAFKRRPSLQNFTKFLYVL